MFNEPKTQWRINWYNEIKTPFLSTAVLCDNGTDCLPEKIKLLKRIVDSEFSGGNRGYSVEEEYMKYAVSSKQLHQRAKVIIYQMIDQL